MKKLRINPFLLYLSRWISCDSHMNIMWLVTTYISGAGDQALRPPHIIGPYLWQPREVWGLDPWSELTSNILPSFLPSLHPILFPLCSFERQPIIFPAAYSLQNYTTTQTQLFCILITPSPPHLPTPPNPPDLHSLTHPLPLPPHLPPHTVERDRHKIYSHLNNGRELVNKASTKPLRLCVLIHSLSLCLLCLWNAQALRHRKGGIGG